MNTFKLLFPIAMVLIGFSCDKEDTNPNGTNECDAEILADCYAHNWKEFLSLDMTVDGAHYKTQYTVSGTISIFSYKATLNTICDLSKFIVDLSSSLDPNLTNFDYLGEVYIEAEDFKLNFVEFFESNFKKEQLSILRKLEKNEKLVEKIEKENNQLKQNEMVIKYQDYIQKNPEYLEKIKSEHNNFSLNEEVLSKIAFQKFQDIKFD